MSNDNDHVNQVLKFRFDRETRLKENERSWLSLVGLFWLEEGDNTFGSDSSNAIKLGNPSIPPHAGSFVYEDDTVTLHVNNQVRMTCNGQDVSSKTLKPDIDDHPDFLSLGSLIMVVIKRGKNTLLRVWDREAPARMNFTGLNYYPIHDDYRITARFVPYNPPRIIKIQDVIGDEYEVEFPGYARFILDGKECQLEAEKTENGLFFNYKDLTNGSGSYPGGRFLVTPEPNGNEVVIDFNRSYNPPCAYTDYATCPLPPPQNRLPVRIPAGEMTFQLHD